ncbi:MAG: transposase [Leptospiraceae bacterium]|nr:transposase [Leptospiraceae bacterium]
MTGHRKSYRKANHDYASPGFYFITLLVKDRNPVFGKLFFDRVELSDYGKIARSCLLSLEESFSFIKLDEYIIMPDHIHAIIQIQEPHSSRRHHRKDLINQVLTMMSDPSVVDVPTIGNVTTPIQSDKNTTDKSWILMLRPEMHLGKIIRHYKAKTSFLIHKEGLKQFQWVSRYYDHIIRTEKSLHYIRKYIQENPIRHQERKAA